MNLAASLQQAKDNDLASRTPSAFALALTAKACPREGGDSSRPARSRRTGMAFPLPLAEQ